MKWLKKWSYLLLLLSVGGMYLTCVDKWRVYAEPLARYSDSHGETEGNGLQEAEGGTKLPADGMGNHVSPETADDQDVQMGKAGGDCLLGAEDGKNAPDRDGSDAGNPGLSGDSDPEDGQYNGSDPENGQYGDSNSEDGQGGDPVYQTVEDDYFSDAVFIGDSRTVGLYEYGGLEETAAFYASTGLTIYKMFDSPIVPVPGERKKITVEEALGQNTFAKIYLMIGINEMGTGTVESFLEKYRETVEHLQELQPDAILYLQAIIKVSSERSAQGDYIHNEGIVARNEGIAQLADNVKVFYLDVNPLICDETGGLTSSYTFDGVHLKAKYIYIWKDYLKSHAIFLD